MNITVYLGANEGNDPCLRKSVEELGAWIGSSGNALVYGGSKSGLMGAIADSVLQAGGKVTDLFGNDQRYDRPTKGFIASNGIVHDELVEIVKEASR